MSIQMLNYRSWILMFLFVGVGSFSYGNIQANEASKVVQKLNKDIEHSFSKKEKRALKLLKKQSKKLSKSTKKGGLRNILLGIVLTLLGGVLFIGSVFSSSGIAVLLSTLVMLAGIFFIIRGIIRLFQ